MPPWYNIELPSLHHYDNPPDLDVADERNSSPQPHISDSRPRNAPWASKGGSLNDSADNLWRAESPPSTATGHQDARTPILNQHETFRCSVGTKSPLESKRRRFLFTWLTCAGALVSTVFSVYYSYTVLVSERAVPQALSLSPGKTVMAINVLSHVVAYLLWNLVTDANEELRWSLACRPQGVSLTSFLVLSRATPLQGVAYLCTVWGGHILWALQKIIGMGLVTLLGLVLITDVTFKNMYTAVPSSAHVPVVAGLAPLSVKFLPYVPDALISVYAGSYTAGFLTDPRFVANMEPLHCNGDTCLSIFLPGGLHTVREANGDRNSTLFKGKLGGQYESIIVNQAPGYQVEFYDLPSSYRFKSQDCKIYMNEIGFAGYGLYVCIAADGSDLLSGWTVCPKDVGVGDCGKNTTWTEKYPMDQSTTTSMYQRYATVAYDAKNMSILSIERLSSPKVTPVDAEIIRTYFDIVMKDQPAFANSSAPAFSINNSSKPVFEDNSEAADSCTSYMVQYGIFWILSLYKSDFTSYADGGLAILRGFLSIPLQFSTEIWQQAAMDTLPPDLRVSAQLSRVSYRALIQAWTVYIFAGSAFIVLGWGIGCLWWCYHGPYTPNSSYFPEIDITSKGTSPAAAVRTSSGSYAPSMRSGRVSSRTLHYPQFGPFEKGVEQEEELEDLEYLMRKLGLGNGMSRAVVKGINGKRIYCGAYLGEMGEADHIVIVTEKDRALPASGTSAWRICQVATIWPPWTGEGAQFVQEHFTMRTGHPEARRTSLWTTSLSLKTFARRLSKHKFLARKPYGASSRSIYYRSKLARLDFVSGCLKFVWQPLSYIVAAPQGPGQHYNSPSLPRLRNISAMSFSVYTVELLGSGPRNHVRLFVKTQDDGSGQIFHVIGTILQGMTFETRSGGVPENEVLFVPGSKKYVGEIAQSAIGELDALCRSIPPPAAQMNLNGTRKDPTKALRRCREWAEEMKQEALRCGLISL
ncbi:hypothetical protein V497_06501 [Pseudogymnoascus sp. VKM F-4516 (FW-969)]|nr:hypothetical protein V497_06501 [Pseudogymnoascus sp. VKM F-4516 (FW-969)]